MPQASAGVIKYHYYDHDPAFLDQAPPVINTWYEVYHAYDVRQLMMDVSYSDEEETGATIQVRWTCDGQVYTGSQSADHEVQYYFFKDKYTEAEGGLSVDPQTLATGYLQYWDKRAQDFKVEVRVTSVVGTNAHLIGRALYETLRIT